MEKQHVIIIDIEHLEQMTMRMAQALPDLDCPDCCGPVYEFIEIGARFYQEELEWATFARALVHTRQCRQNKPA